MYYVPGNTFQLCWDVFLSVCVEPVQSDLVAEDKVSIFLKVNLGQNYQRKKFLCHSVRLKLATLPSSYGGCSNVYVSSRNCCIRPKKLTANPVTT